MCTKFLSGLAALTLIFISQPTTAHAYLDPGTFTYVIQIIIAALIGGIYAMRSYISRFWHMIFGKKHGENSGNNEKAEGRIDNSNDAN